MIDQFTLAPLSDAVPSDIEGLLDAAFGPDRHLRTAYRVRRGMAWMPELSFMASDADGAIIGLIQCWPVALFGDDGAAHDLVMVGPVAVHPDHQGKGIGIALMNQAMAAADYGPLCDTPMMMIGDYDYYRRWDFDAALTDGWRMDGPFEKARLLARGAGKLGAAVAGEVAARR